jgi:ketosteroid isomerase-like protein
VVAALPLSGATFYVLGQRISIWNCAQSPASFSPYEESKMKKSRCLSLILISMLIGSANYAAAQTSRTDISSQPQTTVDGEIKSLEEARNQAVLHGDVAALDRMTSDDYTFITLRGELRTKSDILKGFASGSFHYESRQISDLKVRVHGDTAIVTGRSVQKGMENGKDYSGDYRFTRVYVRENGHWLTVALQTTLVQQ